MQLQNLIIALIASTSAMAMPLAGSSSPISLRAARTTQKSRDILARQDATVDVLLFNDPNFTGDQDTFASPVGKCGENLPLQIKDFRKLTLLQ